MLGQRRADPRHFQYIAERVPPYLSVIRWLRENDCDCSAQKRELEATVRLYASSAARGQVLAGLDRVQRHR